MHLINAMVATRMLTMIGQSSGLAEGISFGSVWWFVYAGVSCCLVLFAGIMSGLTLGLMSLGLVDLEILQRSGTPTEKKQAGLSLSLSRALFFALIPDLVAQLDLVVNILEFDLFIYLYNFGVILFSASILPVVQKQHQLLVTLLLCNAVAMEV